MKRFLATGVGFHLLLGSFALGQQTTQPTLASATMAPPTTAPTNLAPVKAPPAPGTYEAYNAAATVVHKQYLSLVPDDDFLADANAPARDAVAATAVPLMKVVLNDLDAMIRLKPMYIKPIMALRIAKQAELYALGDAETISALDQASTQSGSAGDIARRIVIRGRWLKAGQDASLQAPLVAQVDKMAAAQPTDAEVTHLIYDMRTQAHYPDVKKHMEDLLANTMDNPVAKSCLRQIALDDKVHSFSGKPMVLTGKTMEGKDFTTADWKGKVVLVDFWATWCVPCRAELPRVQKVYADYHDKGLEVLGVANDESGKQLIKIVDMLKLPWPQLFDADAAAKGAWNPITVSHGINGIPVMFLIDKKGVCRTVTARDNFENMIPQLLAE